MYWKERDCGCYYLGSFEAPGNDYLGRSKYKDVYCYKSSLDEAGLLLQEGNEDWNYGSYPLSIIRRHLRGTGRFIEGESIPIEQVYAYIMYKNKCEGKNEELVSKDTKTVRTDLW